jgi:hypothetical protein
MSASSLVCRVSFRIRIVEFNASSPGSSISGRYLLVSVQAGGHSYPFSLEPEVSCFIQFIDSILKLHLRDHRSKSIKLRHR